MPHLDEDAKLQIVSYGAGTNSTAMLIKMVERSEVVDAITFADTGGELPETYAYLDMFGAWLTERGYPEITRVRVESRTLEEDCLIRKTLPSVVFGFKTCSLRFKAEPQQKFVNNYQPAKDAWARGEKVVKCIGFDADEPNRAKFDEDKKYKWRYPLIEWDMGRAECVETIKAAGLELPGKSACYFCPNSKPHEILRLPREYQDRAIAMERNAEMTKMYGLGRLWKWEDLLRADRAQMDLFKCNTAMPCDCFDGA